MKSSSARPTPQPLLETAGVLFFTAVAFAVMGYHPGIEDDAVYLAAIKADLNPALFPHDANFFRLQLQATVFDKFVAAIVHFTHLPLGWTELLLQLLALYLTLLAVKKIAACFFVEPAAQWGAVACVGAMLTLPVAGTALYLTDQHLHPRNLATALILLAVWHVLEARRWMAASLLVLAFLFHPIMAALGISFCVFLAIAQIGAISAQTVEGRGSMAALIPFGWIFERPTANWRRALDTRTYYFLYKWEWYEWLGAIAPLILFWILWRFARRRSEVRLARFALAVFAYGVFQQALAMGILAIPGLVRLTPLQPMRYLHLVYFFLMLLAGALLGKYLLKRSAWRWAVFLVATNAGMGFAQFAQFPASAHFELPGQAPRNDWQQAFAWIRANTPTDAYFALDPIYMNAPGEDAHGFRALAERSQLADAVKDTAVVTQVPELAPAWAAQVDAQAGWKHFQAADFERLKQQFGVDWVLVSIAQTQGLDCRWHNHTLAVCRIP